MTRVFRSLLLLLIAKHLFVFWYAGLYEPLSLYWYIVQASEWEHTLPWVSAFVASWLVVDVLLVTSLPGTCTTTDKLRVYPLVAAMLMTAVVMVAGYDKGILLFDFGSEMVIITAALLADAAYNKRKYFRGRNEFSGM